ncbi:MAG: zinc-ribbon domain-containing protein, partial [Pseudomonadota bacterium]
MRLICPNCGSQYEVDVTLFPDEGREVQCSNCETVWVQQPVAEEPPLRLDAGAAAEDDDAGPARPSERLDEEERAALARAVRDELAVRDGAEDGAPDDKE